MIRRNRWAVALVAAVLTCSDARVFAQDYSNSSRSATPEVVPKVTQITSDDVTDRIDNPRQKPFSHTFDGPARFPWWEFDRQGNPIEYEALVIDEGMKVTMNDQGEYDIRFRLEAPTVEILLRMQLTIWGRGAGGAEVSKGTITIPLIRIIPEDRSDLDSVSQSYLVTYSGKSAALRREILCGMASNSPLSRPVCGGPLCDSGIRLTRNGTARFGAPPRN